MGADHRSLHRSKVKTVALASLPVPQRRLVAALLEAARTAAIRRESGSNTNIARGGITGDRHGRTR